jgi:uncharacterized MAPEG superfamily protein
MATRTGVSSMFENNPALSVYAIAASIMILKVMLQGWITVARMMKAGGGFVNPEDTQKGLINPSPSPGQTDVLEYVDRSRRMHHNDLENIPFFLVAGLLFAWTSPPLLLAQLAFYSFVLARFLHFWAYLTAKSHEIRATFWTIGSLITIIMSITVLASVLI